MTPLSFEFYPPKTDALRAQLDRAARKLKRYAPKYVSCTFGAGGSTLSQTAETVQHLIQHHGLPAAPHLSCVGGSRAQLVQLLDHYRQLGVKRIVALRGDLQPGAEFPNEMRHAADLVTFIRAEYGDSFRIEVGAYPETHPQATGTLADLDHFIAKMQSGADAAITQYFYNADAYFYFVDNVRKRGINAPIIPGIMPISNFEQLCQFSQQCGADIPRWIYQRLLAYQDDNASLRSFGADVVAALCEKLIAASVPGLHFYTLNLAKPASAVLERLGYVLAPKISKTSAVT